MPHRLRRDPDRRCHPTACGFGETYPVSGSAVLVRHVSPKRSGFWAFHPGLRCLGALLLPLRIGAGTLGLCRRRPAAHGQGAVASRVRRPVPCTGLTRPAQKRLPPVSEVGHRTVEPGVQRPTPHPTSPRRSFVATSQWRRDGRRIGRGQVAGTSFAILPLWSPRHRRHSRASEPYLERAAESRMAAWQRSRFREALRCLPGPENASVIFVWWGQSSALDRSHFRP